MKFGNCWIGASALSSAGNGSAAGVQLTRESEITPTRADSFRWLRVCLLTRELGLAVGADSVSLFRGLNQPARVCAAVRSGRSDRGMTLDWHGTKQPKTEGTYPCAVA